MVERQLYPSSSTKDIMNLASTSSSAEPSSNYLRRVRQTKISGCEKTKDDSKSDEQQQKEGHFLNLKNEKHHQISLYGWDKMILLKPFYLLFIGIILSIIFCLFTYYSSTPPLSRRSTVISVPKTLYSGKFPLKNKHHIK